MAKKYTIKELDSIIKEMHSIKDALESGKKVAYYSDWPGSIYAHIKIAKKQRAALLLSA